MDLSNKNPTSLINSMLRRFTGAISGVKTLKNMIFPHLLKGFMKNRHFFAFFGSKYHAFFAILDHF
jgi:hypothetical protein